jgi:hypothetical protein
MFRSLVVVTLCIHNLKSIQENIALLEDVS